MKKKSNPLPPPFPPSSSSSSSTSFSSTSSSDASDSESGDRELQPQVIQTALASTSHAKPELSPPPSESNSEECEDGWVAPSFEDTTTATTPAPSTTNNGKNPFDKANDPSSSTSGAGKKLFQRLWTDEDELALIKGLVKYNQKHGKDPSTASEYSAFLDQMKGRLHIEFSKDQFMTKLRNIKIKYTKYLGKLMNGSITSVKEHDQNCFNLLMKVWGDELKRRSSKKDIKNGDVVVKNEAMDSGESGPKKKKKKTEAGVQVNDNGNGADVEDVVGACSNILTDVFRRHNIETSMKYKMKNVLLSMEPKELKDWEKRFVSKYNLKWDVLRDLNDLENEFIQTLWKNLKS